MPLEIPADAQVPAAWRNTAGLARSLVQQAATLAHSMPGGRLARELGDRAVFQVAGVMRMADGIANAAPLLANDEATYRLPTPAPQAAAAPASGLRRSHATAEAEANERGKRRSPAPRNACRL